MSRKKVIIGMSGGVDSSVSAMLLQEQGFDVTCLFMKNWEEEGPCQSAKDYEDVARVAEHLGLPYYTINFSKEYWDSVFTEFLEDLKQGYTPNPDILCNREIKFKALFNKAMQLGADFLATGHYAQIQHLRLTKGKDPSKDQSYFLYAISPTVLPQVLFPVGHLHKKEVRELARKRGLPTSEKKDSTGICFIGERNFRSFLSGYIAYQKGLFKKLSGEVIGEHLGVAYYTIGQRKGLNIGGKGDAWFVVDKDPATNTVYVEQGKDHPSLYKPSLIATSPNWLSLLSPSFPLRCSSKIRYRQEDQPCTVFEEEGHLKVVFDTPQRAITLKQAIVFYDGDVCLGGATITG